VTGLLVVSLLALGCGTRREFTCLSGPLGQRYVDDPALQLIQREYQRAQELNEAAKARVYESLPRIFPDYSNRADEPLCSRELVTVLERRLEERPFPLNNETLHYLAALGNVRDINTTIHRKATLWVDLATIPDDEVSPYQMEKGKKGRAPNAGYLRRRALAELAHSNLYLNDTRVRQLIHDKMLTSTSAPQQLLLLPQGRHAFDWQPNGKVDANPLTARWLKEAPLTLQSRADAPTFELLLQRLQLLAQEKRYAAKVRPLLKRIVHDDGELPLTQGQTGWSRDLMLIAWQGLWRMKNGKGRGRFARLPHPARDAWKDTNTPLEDTTTLIWPSHQSSKRLKAIDEELLQIEEPRLRCWLYDQRAQWTPRAEARTWFESFLDKEHASNCAILKAVQSEAVPFNKRLAFILKAIETRSTHAPSVLSVVQKNLGWLAQHPRLREVILFESLNEDLGQVSSPGRTMGARIGVMQRSAHQRVLHEAVALTIQNDTKNREVARKIVTQWIELMKETGTPHYKNSYSWALYSALFFDIAEFAPALELEAEALSLIEPGEFANDPDAPPPHRWLERQRELARWVFSQARGGAL